jgi:hypothetical protein
MTQYKGHCILFVGKDYDHVDDIWIMESEEDTIIRLKNALEKLDINCSSIAFKWTDEITGQRCCVCDCVYNKPYETYHSELFIEFFIEGLCQCSYAIHCPLDFYLTEEPTGKNNDTNFL